MLVGRTKRPSRQRLTPPWRWAPLWVLGLSVLVGVITQAMFATLALPQQALADVATLLGAGDEQTDPLLDVHGAELGGRGAARQHRRAVLAVGCERRAVLSIVAAASAPIPARPIIQSCGNIATESMYNALGRPRAAKALPPQSSGSGVLSSGSELPASCRPAAGRQL